MITAFTGSTNDRVTTKSSPNVKTASSPSATGR